MFCLANDLLLFGSFSSDGTHFGIILCIEIAIILRNVDIDFAAWFEICRREFLGFVVTFGTPSDVVGITEGIDVENIDVSGCQEKVLEKLEPRISRVDSRIVDGC